MSSARPVLVLTDPYDVTADYVVEELNRRDHPVFRCDTGDFPERLALHAELGARWTGRIQLNDRAVSIEDIGCAYYRRPSDFELPDHLGDEERRWARREARRGLGGLLSALPHWLNHPSAIAAAEYKPVQLQVAVNAGLLVPPTIVTNDPDQARRFVTRVQAAIYKPMAGGLISEHGQHKLTFANRVGAEEIDDSVRGTAHLLQAWVPKSHEVRVTVVDKQFFAVRIDAESAAAHLDWRSDYPNLRYRTIDVPEDVRASVVTVLDSLGLRFGALDFVVDHQDRWVFLEINPNGQWAWLQDATGVPIAAAIADALTAEHP
ncbi:ATP-grasp ribosomal peptide maturase [Pseudonocardia endophytica]|uniref:ATP-grasp ribosomal peptide maturase n=1 Tax=Pseudonocardia endophytica TaxID=401976 RepID=A0A4R1HJ71_PSEEN|nr:ATP-grasp ribosomal peptide maturase [Pseudonocardia endophytica]TCK20943.1 ATP-grasp ribosomal peptide maturase [Pseudonocardia endophytica]